MAGWVKREQKREEQVAERIDIHANTLIDIEAKLELIKHFSGVRGQQGSAKLWATLLAYLVKLHIVQSCSSLHKLACKTTGKKISLSNNLYSLYSCTSVVNKST